MGEMADLSMQRDFWDYPEEHFCFQHEPCHLRYLRIEEETPKAWKVVFSEQLPFEKKQCWLPKSRCTLDTDEREFLVPHWLVLRNDLEGFEK